MYEWKSAEHSGSLGYEMKKLRDIEGFWEGAQKSGWGDDRNAMTFLILFPVFLS